MVHRAFRRRACRWEEAKIGLVQKPGEVDRLYSVQPTSGLEQSFNDLLALACIKGWDESTEVRGLADGARHIRPRMEMVFDIGNFRFILDRPHCKEHLSSAGEALEPITGVPAQQWADEALKKLEAGKSAEVVAEHKQAWEDSGPDEESRNDTLRLEAGYFERNHDAVAYAHYRDQGWSTASSEVESGHRHFVQVRCKISGAWWHPRRRTGAGHWSKRVQQGVRVDRGLDLQACAKGALYGQGAAHGLHHSPAAGRGVGWTGGPGLGDAGPDGSPSDRGQRRDSMPRGCGDVERGHARPGTQRP